MALSTMMCFVAECGEMSTFSIVGVRDPMRDVRSVPTNSQEYLALERAWARAEPQIYKYRLQMAMSYCRY